MIQEQDTGDECDCFQCALIATKIKLDAMEKLMGLPAESALLLIEFVDNGS